MNPFKVTPQEKLLRALQRLAMSPLQETRDSGISDNKGSLDAQAKLQQVGYGVEPPSHQWAVRPGCHAGFEECLPVARPELKVQPFLPGPAGLSVLF